MKTMKTLFQKVGLMKGVLGIAVCLTIFCCSGFVSRAAEGTVIPETAKIRAQADGNSEVVGSTTKGKVIDIVGAENDSAGVKWYKVPIAGNSYGFIRSDLVQTSEDIPVSASTASAPSDGGSAPAATVPTAIGEQQATVSTASAKIRSGASTQHESVGSLPQGTAVTLIGEANDSAGKKWYQITGSYNGRNIEGYIRSDLVTLGAAAPAEPEQPAEGGENPEGEAPEGEGEAPEGEGENPEGGGEEPQEPAEPEHRDYEVVYNEDVYWLYDNTNGTMMKVQDLLDVVNKANENSADLEKQVQNEKIIIIILAVIIVVLVIVITVLLLKIRNLYYEDYEDDEEEEEEEEIEEEPVIKRKKRAAPVQEYEEPVRRKRPAPEEPEERVRPSREKQQQRPAKERPVRPAPAEEAELQAAERKQPAKKPAPRKTQNFLLDDDEFEFEFLNMDDKDL